MTLRPDRDVLAADLVLLDGASGLQVWGEQIQAPNHDAVLLRSLLAGAVARSLRPDLEHALAKTVARSIVVDPEAYELALRASALVESENRIVLEQAGGLLRRAMALDPGLALAKRVRGELEYVRYYYGWGGDQRNLELARHFLEEAIASDPEDSRAYHILIQFIGCSSRRLGHCSSWRRSFAAERTRRRSFSSLRRRIVSPASTTRPRSSPSGRRCWTRLETGPGDSGPSAQFVPVGMSRPFGSSRSRLPSSESSMAARGPISLLLGGA
jgi:hypothetical protein